MWICIGVLYGQIVLPKPEIDAASRNRQPKATDHRPPTTDRPRNPTAVIKLSCELRKAAYF